MYKLSAHESAAQWILFAALELDREFRARNPDNMGQ